MRRGCQVRRAAEHGQHLETYDATRDMIPLIEGAVTLLLHAQHGRVDHDIAEDGAVALLLKALFLIEVMS